MNWKDILYFGYKYYFKSSILPGSDYVKEHFSNRETDWQELDKVLVTVSIGGDLMPYEVVNIATTNMLWDEVGRPFFSNDIVFANLETPLVEEVKPVFVPELMLKDMLFNTNKHAFQIFSGSGYFKGYDILSIANNHSMDQGMDGIDRTIDFVNACGVRTIGAKSRSFERDFEIIEKNGVKIGFLAFTYSMNQFLMDEEFDWKVNCLPLNRPDCPIDSIYEQVMACRAAGAEFIICSLHGGNAYQAYPSEVTVKLYEKLFRMFSIDVIVGGHPHNLQPWKQYQVKDVQSGKIKNCFAIYSLGDFIAYDIYTWCHLCAFLKLEIGRNKAGEVIFKPVVRPMVMLKIKDQFQLKFAENVFQTKRLKGALKDMKVLYDICVGKN